MPRLVSVVSTKSELVKEIVTLLLRRSKQQRELASCSGKIHKEQLKYASLVLEDLAGEISCIEVRNAEESRIETSLTQ